MAAEKQVVPLACLHLHWDLTTRDGGFMAREEWRDIAGYEGRYQVSNLGRVRSLDIRVPCHDNGTRTVYGRILKQSMCGGYFKVGLCKDGKMVNRTIHRLVAEAFIERIEGKDYVDHINGDRHDNRVENLRWVTAAENNRHIHELGHFNREAISQRMREYVAAHGTATPPKAVIRSDGQVFESISEAARAIDASQGNVSSVILGKRHTCKGYSFRLVGQTS